MSDTWCTQDCVWMSASISRLEERVRQLEEDLEKAYNEVDRLLNENKALKEGKTKENENTEGN